MDDGTSEITISDENKFHQQSLLLCRLAKNYLFVSWGGTDIVEERDSEEYVVCQTKELAKIFALVETITYNKYVLINSLSSSSVSIVGERYKIKNCLGKFYFAFFYKILAHNLLMSTVCFQYPV